MPDFPDPVTTAQGISAAGSVNAGGNISAAGNISAGGDVYGEDLCIGEPNNYGLVSYYAGRLLLTTVLMNEAATSGTPNVPYSIGATFYHAVNLDVGAVGTFPAGFWTETANVANSSPGYHVNDDNVGVFGSIVYSGGTIPGHTTTFVGGLIVQASENHGSGSLGTRLLFAYTPNGGNEAEVGACLDGSGTFAVTHDFRHLYGNVGFYNRPAVPRGEYDKNQFTNTEDRLAELIRLLHETGLIKDVNLPEKD